MCHFAGFQLKVGNRRRIFLTYNDQMSVNIGGPRGDDYKHRRLSGFDAV
jgi:hypothetical protein